MQSCDFEVFAKEFKGCKILYFIKHTDKATEFAMVNEVNNKLYCWYNASSEKLSLKGVHNYCQNEDNINFGFSSDELSDFECIFPGIEEISLKYKIFGGLNYERN